LLEIETSERSGALVFGGVSNACQTARRVERFNAYAGPWLKA